MTSNDELSLQHAPNKELENYSSESTQKIFLSQGAEAKIYKEGNIVYKERIPKTYRQEELDKRLRTSRTKRELKVINKTRALGIPVPRAEIGNNSFTIKMDFIDGERLRDTLLQEPNETKKYLVRVGEWIATMHDEGIIHGDLTTSNILITPENNLFLIDFGLSFFSEKKEDKAVDIHLFKQAIESTHYLHTKEFYSFFLQGYSQSKNSKEVLERLEEVERRGRNKE